MTTLYYIASILFCIGFIWGMYVKALDKNNLWMVRGIIGGCIFAMLPLTGSIVIYSLWKKKQLTNSNQ